MTLGWAAKEPQHVIEPVCTFFGAAIADVEGLSRSTVAVAGLYCDHFGHSHPGARFAARQIRYASRPPYGRRRPRVGREGVRDIGDLNVFPLEPDRTEAILSDQVERILRTGSKLLVIGGDYSLTPLLLRGAMAALSNCRFGFIRLSRQLDLAVASEIGGTRTARFGATARIATKLSNGPGAIAVLGVRGPQPSPPRNRPAAETVLTAARVAAALVPAVEAVKSSPISLCEAIYLSVDVDVLSSPMVALGGWRPGAGLDLAQVLALIGGLRRLPIVAADLHGFAPDLGLGGMDATTLVSELGDAIVDVLRSGEPRCH